MRKSDRVEVKIIKIDHENRRISLGLKQLSDDPWPEIAKKYAVGTESLGTISRVMDRGVVVDLDGEVEGFVPTAQLGNKELNDPTGVFKEGEQIPLQVIEFDSNLHKIVLSVTAYYRKRERTELEEFLAKHSADTSRAIADAMPEELKETVELATDEPTSSELATSGTAPSEQVPVGAAEAEPSVSESVPSEATPETTPSTEPSDSEPPGSDSSPQEADRPGEESRESDTEASSESEEGTQ